MILVDTSVWIDHFIAPQQELQRLLYDTRIAIHPYIVTELALGSLQHRQRTLTFLEMLPQVGVARNEEVRHFIEAHHLYTRGIGFVDAHLLASCLVVTNLRLWTRDKSLRKVAEELAVAYTF